MSVEGPFVMLLVGLVIGWLAATFIRGSPALGLAGNVVVGVAGAFIGGLLLPASGDTRVTGLVAVIVSATIGAVVLLTLLRYLRRA